MEIVRSASSERSREDVAPRALGIRRGSRGWGGADARHQFFRPGSYDAVSGFVQPAGTLFEGIVGGEHQLGRSYDRARSAARRNQGETRNRACPLRTGTCARHTVCWFPYTTCPRREFDTSYPICPMKVPFRRLQENLNRWTAPLPSREASKEKALRFAEIFGRSSASRQPKRGTKLAPSRGDGFLEAGGERCGS